MEPDPASMPDHARQVATATFRARLILASSSPRRLDLLRQVGLEPDEIRSTDIDERARRAELPRDVAKRLAREKAEAALLHSGYGEGGPAYLLAADTVVAVGRRVLPKALIEAEAQACLGLLSGRAHRVFTAVVLVTPGGQRRERLVETRIRMKRLSAAEIDAYLRSGEWRGKAGGYAIQGLAAAFVLALAGSYSAVVGLPLYETCALLDGAGYPVRRGWREGEGRP